MSDFRTNVISIIKVQQVLQKLLAGYESEKEDNERDNNERGTEYWESACETIEEVAAELRIALGSGG